jgi:MFS family permease
MSAFALCGLLVSAILPILPPLETTGPAISPRGFFRHAPVLVAAVAVAAGFEQAVLTLLPVYGAAYAMDEKTLSALVSVLIAGSIALQVPLGFAAERVSARSVLIACAFGSALCCVGLPFSMSTDLMWPLALVLGGLSYGIYTMGIVELGERFSGPLLVAGNAAFAITWGIGGIAGPLTTGTVMDAIGVQGFPLAVGLFCLALGGFALLNHHSRPVPNPVARQRDAIVPSQ